MMSRSFLRGEPVTWVGMAPMGLGAGSWKGGGRVQVMAG